MTIKVMIVEDDPDFLRRFCDVVHADLTLSLCGAVSTICAAKALIDVTSPDVILVDLGLPDGSGIEVIRHACAVQPNCDVLVVTMFGDDGSVIDSLSAGATGYLLKDAPSERIATAIYEIRAGGAPISPSIARRVLQRFRQTPPESLNINASNSTDQKTQASLSQRERDILQLVAKGLSFEDISQVLEISPHTVVTHIKRIYRKLAVHSRGEAVFEAQLQGLL